MKTMASLFFRGGWILLLASLVVRPLLAQGGGVITGQVSNAATRTFLQGAVVTLAGTSHTTVTDREGRYQFTGLERSEMILEVSFTGLDTQRVPVTVASGQRVVRDIELTSEIYKLDKFTVAGEREGTAKAETMQRLARK